MSETDNLERTWDGEPISPTPPYGATVVIYRHAGEEREFLTLHRRHGGPDFDGDWTWGPPSGGRYPDEAIVDCARRELREETGLDLVLQPTGNGSENWFVFLAEAPAAAEVSLSDEHDRFAWLSLAEVIQQVAPDLVREQVVEAARLLVAERYDRHLKNEADPSSLNPLKGKRA
jgi:8-oxo-dGTP pyrophosphatase MutT (NUDIX family)